MAHPLDGARFKIIRAQEHLSTLKTEISSYIQGEPYGIAPYEREDEHGPWRKIHVTHPPPATLSLILGDCVTNARAALDYIIWELSGQPFFRPSRSDTDKKWLSFPISIGTYDARPTPPESQGLVNAINGLAHRGVPTAALDEIKASQPYIAENLPLWWLSQLVNLDKHRTLVMTTGLLGDISVTFKEPTHVFTESFSVGGGATRFSLTKTGAESIPIATLPVDMDVQASIYVALQDVAMPREPVDLVLEKIIKCVADVVTRFIHFFP